LKAFKSSRAGGRPEARGERWVTQFNTDTFSSPLPDLARRKDSHVSLPEKPGVDGDGGRV